MSFNLSFLPENVSRILFIALLLNVAGILVELYFLDHFEDTFQWIPLIVLGLSTGILVSEKITDSRRLLDLFAASMLLLMIAGVVGIYFHLAGNSEFVSESYPNATTFEHIRRVLHGATPAFAPGSLVGMGIVGFAYHSSRKKEKRYENE